MDAPSARVAARAGEGKGGGKRFIHSRARVTRRNEGEYRGRANSWLFFSRELVIKSFITDRSAIKLRPPSG